MAQLTRQAPPVMPCAYCGTDLQPQHGDPILTVNLTIDPDSGEVNPDARYYCTEAHYQAGDPNPVPSPMSWRH